MRFNVFCETFIIVRCWIKLATTPIRYINAINKSDIASDFIFVWASVSSAPSRFIIGLSIYVPARFVRVLMITQNIAINTLPLSSPMYFKSLMIEPFMFFGLDFLPNLSIRFPGPTCGGI